MSESFDERCYALLKQIPKGKVTTYKLLAEALGTKAYRAVGNAMAKNPHLVTVPCHRVVKSDGGIGGYAEGVERKIELLRDEGVNVTGGKIEPLERYLFTFS
ncbi:MAG: MGMT family protein [Sulfurimonadaceae bacterium]|nr:MGMT family protein [Sulfurimonadaceae bacterium]